MIHQLTPTIQEQIQTTDEEYRFLFENNPHPMCVYDDETLRFLAVNESAIETYGYSKEELLTMTMKQLCRHEEIPALLEALRRFDEVPMAERAWHHLKKDGSMLFVEVKSRPTRFAGRNAHVALIRDVSKRAVAEYPLNMSDTKLRMLMETTTAAIFFYRIDHFEFVNTAIERITGYTQNELSAMQLWNPIHPEHREMVVQRAAARLRGEDVPTRYEIKIITKANDVRWIDLSLALVRTEGEVAILGTGVDITDKKKAEEELRRSEELTHRILEAVPGGILEVSQDGKILQANIEAQRFFGLSALDFLKLSISDLADKQLWEDGAKVDSKDLPVVKCLQKREDQDPITMGVRRPDGNISWAVFTAVPLLDITTGNSSGAVLTFLDITGRKHTEDALRESEERYRKFFEEDLTGDFIANSDGCILACNPAFVTIFGFESVESAMHCNLKTIFAGQYAFETITETLLRKKKIEYYEAVGRRLDGYPVYIIENLIGLFDAQGTLTGVKGYVFDNTAHKLLEQQVQEAQKIESIGRLAGGIAHDFNNLLGIILGYSERVLNARESASNYLQDVKAIRTAAQRGANLVKQLLTFARKTSVAFEEMNVNSIVDELGKLLKETFPRTIALEIDVDPSVPLITADANQIHQAVLNLCVNARDAMPGGGTLTLKTETVSGANLRTRFTEAYAEFYACIRVTDTGVGMGEEIRKNIFEPFFSTKERGKGTGLGLAVVYGIVNTHRGIIDVTSEQGKGATLSLYFPIPESRYHSTMTEELRRPEAAGGSETILVVEDEEMMLELVQSLLESKGYRILTAQDGKAAVEIYKQHQDEIDLVLTDLGLPKLGGREACQQMRALNPKLNVIVATGYLDPAAKEQMIESGIEEFVQKPYHATELTTKVREILDARRKM